MWVRIMFTFNACKTPFKALIYILKMLKDTLKYKEINIEMGGGGNVQTKKGEFKNFLSGNWTIFERQKPYTSRMQTYLNEIF